MRRRLYLIGGCFLDSLGFLVLTIPIFFPLGVALGFEPIWYSILLTMVTTMGAITPPVGVNIYVVKALAPDIKLGTIFPTDSASAGHTGPADGQPASGIWANRDDPAPEP